MEAVAVHQANKPVMDIRPRRPVAAVTPAPAPNTAVQPSLAPAVVPTNMQKPARSTAKTVHAADGGVGLALSVAAIIVLGLVVLVTFAYLKG